jgi:CxxC motif-containing protein (DUF1111 family)
MALAVHKTTIKRSEVLIHHQDLLIQGVIQMLNHNTYPLASFLVFSVTTLLLAEIVLITNTSAQPNLSLSSDLQITEQFPGGKTTHHQKIGPSSFSHGSANMRFNKELDFKIGNAIFRRLWVSAPSATLAADGLGPLYNARSCERCHLKDGRGHPPTENSQDNNISLFMRLSIPPQTDFDKNQLQQHRVNVIAEPTYGTQLQDFSIRGHQAEGKIKISYNEHIVHFATGESVSLRKPHYKIIDLAYGSLHPDTQLSPRIAPPMIGLGLLEAIDKETILQYENTDSDLSPDQISGRANWVWSQEFHQVMLGRFGWKAGSPSINEQSQAAFSGDMGISVTLFPKGSGECTQQQPDCLNAPNGNSPQYDNVESGKMMTDLVVFYARNLSVPARRHFSAPEVLRGKQLFYNIGCIGCHRPSYTTKKDSIGREQSAQKIWPYSDLLLHDMGKGLADFRSEGVANGQEWRTPPLWGIGLTPIVNKHSFYLHDGRARNLLEAILWHGGEAKKQRDLVLQLTQQQRQDLLRFVESL